MDKKDVVKTKSKRLPGEKPPPGIRNNNPLNIMRSKSCWIGQTNYDSKDRFCKFSHLYYGWRAALIIIAATYFNRDWNTIRLIIEHWAPYTENDTDSYIAFVSKYTGIKENTVLPRFYASPDTYCRILTAMAKIECGYAWIRDDEILELKSVSHYMELHNVLKVK